MYPKCLHPKYWCLHREMPIKETGVNKYSKIHVSKMPTPKGFSFAQGYSNRGNSGRGVCNKIGRDVKTYERKYWKDK